MAKVFISILGTTDYVECSYKHPESDLTCQTRFIQEATIRMNCADWDENDRILIFTTEDAEKRNWLDDGQIDRETGQIKVQQGLRSRLKALCFKPSIENIRIPEGKTIEEIWSIFNLIFSQLRQCDEIVFDITHSFRSIPMLVMVILNYAKVVRNVSLSGIYYGAMESLGNLSEVQRMPVSDRIIPVFDLSAFDELLDWATAIERFLESGDGTMVYEVASEKSRKIKKIVRRPDANADSMKNIAARVKSFSEEVYTCRGQNLPQSIAGLKEEIRRGIQVCSEPALLPLLEHLDDRLECFSGNPVHDGLRAVEWCLEHNLIQQGFTILREFLIGYVCQGFKIDPHDFGMRERMEDCIGKDVNVWNRNVTLHGGTETTAMLDSLPLVVFKQKQELLEIFSPVMKLRNDINHAGMRREALDPATLRSELQRLVSLTKEHILKQTN